MCRSWDGTRVRSGLANLLAILIRKLGDTECLEAFARLIHAFWMTVSRFADQLRASSALHSLWETGELCDCILCPAGVGQASGLRAHRLILAAASPYCRSLFSGPWAQTQDGDVAVIDLPTLSLDAVRAVLEAIYREELEVVLQLLDAA